jgi:sec-independent protein translocase protein TatB
MFDLFSWSHILVLLIVALVVVGPKDLPKLMRSIGQWTGKARAMASEFRRSFDEMARQSELDELRKEIESLRSERPLAGVERDLASSVLPPEHRSEPLASDTASADIAAVSHEAEAIDHDHGDEEPTLPEPEHVAEIAKGPPAP